MTYLLSKLYYKSKYYLTAAILAFSFSIMQVPSAYSQEATVYSRCERTTATYELTGSVVVNGQSQTLSRTMKGLDIYDVLPDVTNFFSGFSAPCDLILRSATGVETVIYDCSSTSTQANSCAALDPSVSFDGNIIAFSVFHGTLENHVEFIESKVLHPDASPGNLGWHYLPNKKLLSTGANLHFYNVETGVLTEFPFQSNVFDTGPTFITNNRIAYTSTLDGNTTAVVWGTTSSKRGSRIWTVDIDGKNPDLASHHSLSQEQHPFMLRDGRLAYSSWQIFGGLPFRYNNGSPGSFTTLDNLFHIYAQDPDGARNFPIYGQHSGDHANSYFGEEHSAAHFITQTSDDRIWFADYYRGNNNGLGVLIGVMPEPAGKEGVSPYTAGSDADMYVPTDTINFASWATNSDTMSKVSTTPAIYSSNYSDPIPFLGKVGHPAALPNNGLMLTWGKGACSTVASAQVYVALNKPIPPETDGSGGGKAMNNITSLGLDIPGCDAGLYKATVVPSLHPNDLELIVDSPDWHEIMARAVVPYSAVHGIDTPAIVERADIRSTHALLNMGTPFGLLGSASITDRETAPKDGIHFAGEHQFNLQGTDTIDYTDDELCGVRILGIMPNRSINSHNDIANYAGERVTILGEFPVLNRYSDGTRVIDASGNPDTSFLVRMPANTPYMMQGIDCDGRTLNTDQTWQSLRPGEVKTCNGCHLHSGTPRIQFSQSFANTTEYTIPRLGENLVPLLYGLSGNTVNTTNVPGYGMHVEFTKDIKPIFDQHCISCHSGSSPAGGLSLDDTGSINNVQGTTWWCLVADKAQSCVTPSKQMDTGYGLQFRRPQMTRYIRAFNSRGSLLYWKAANQRADNRTDNQYTDDIDFGAAHPTTITANELGLLSRWIDTGAAGGINELIDTQKPTLHLAADAATGSISELYVGTVDLGSGINPDSLIVCVLDSGSTCNNIAGTAEPHGVTVVNLGGSLSTPDTEIYASVRDMANNITEVRRTVEWLLNSPVGTPPPPPPVDTESPVITITSPTSGQIVSGIVPVTVSYTDNVGVTSVSLFVDGLLTSTNTEAPFSFSIDSALMNNADHTISVVAYDAAGNPSDQVSIVVTVNNNVTDTQVPTVGIVSPISGNVSGTVPVEYSYSDNIGVVSINLYINGQLYSTTTQEPFSTTINTATMSNGTYTVNAHAFDAAGNQGTSNDVLINVNNVPADTKAPIVGVNLYAYTVISGNYPIEFNAYDNVAVTKVDLEVNGQFYSSSTQAPFTMLLDTTTMPNGNHTLRAYAYDAAGNMGASYYVTVVVDNTAPPTSSDTEAPIVGVNLYAYTVISGNYPIEFNAYDNIGVVRIDLEVDGQFYSTSTQAPFTMLLDTTVMSNGTHNLRAYAYDAAGNMGASYYVAVTISN